MRSRWLILAALSLGTALVLSYGPDSGHGFYKDDFRWIVESRARTSDDLLRLFSTDNGFYRPIVSLTFAANEALFGAWARGYALTNLALLLLCGAAVFVLGRALKMEPGVALFAASLWSLNPHGISGTVMWISGRTSSLVTLFSLAAGVALVRQRRWLAAVLCLLALLSKEEAFFLPLVLTIWAGWQPNGGGWRARRAVTHGWPLFLSLVPYLILRSQTQAYLPATAPSYYRFTFAPAQLGRNVLEYADRAATFSTAATLLLLLAVRRTRRLEPLERYWIALGVVWTLGCFGLTVFVPTRSSLYVCLPSVGVVLVGAALGRSIWSKATRRLRLTLLIVGVLVPLALVPLHRARNRRPRQAADLSARVSAQIKELWPRLPAGSTLVLHDELARRPNLYAVFGSLLGQAITLTTGSSTTVEYLPQVGQWTEARVHLPAGDPPGSLVELRLGDDGLEPLER